MLGHLLFSFTAPNQHEELRRQLTPDGQPTPAPSTSAAAAAAASPCGASGDDSMSSADSASTLLSSPAPSSSSASAAAAAPPLAPSAAATAPSPGSSCASAGSPAPSTSGTSVAAAVAGASDGASAGPQRQRRSFILNMSQRAVSRGDAAHYEPFSVLGYLHVPGRPPPPTGPRTHARRPPEPPTPSANDTVLIAVVQQHKERSISDLSILEATREEYVTRHFKDGRIAYSDHRISMVAGYMSDEVSGLSAFEFMHKDDVNFTVVALQQMYDLGQGAGGSAYRLKAKTGAYIYLRTQGFLEFNKKSGEVDALICINSLLTEEEGERLIKEMKIRFAATVAQCQQITETGGPLAKALSPGFIAPPIMAAPERPLPSPGHLEDHHFTQPNPCSDAALSPVQGSSPGSSQFASIAIHSPPAPTQPQVSPPVPQYPSVITGPNSVSAHMERPTVLRQTQSVITERVSVLTTAGNPSETSMDSNELSERNRWGFKEVSVLKRANSLDGNSSSSKRLHTGTQRLRRRDSQPPSVTEALVVEVPHCPLLSPKEQHQALVARQVQQPALLQSPAYRGQWPSASVPSTHSPLADPSFATPYISPSALTDQDQSLEDLGNLSEALFNSFDADGVPLQSLPADPADWSFGDGLGVPSSHAISLTASGVELDQSSVVQYTSVEHHLQIQHQVLQTRMKYQETQMNQLEQSLDTVPMSDQTLQNSLSHLKDQHKKQLQMLHTLKQDTHCLQRQETLGTGPCVKQDLGV